VHYGLVDLCVGGVVSLEFWLDSVSSWPSKTSPIVGTLDESSLLFRILIFDLLLISEDRLFLFHLLGYPVDDASDWSRLSDRGSVD